MCDFKQREYSCGHMRWLATKHCPYYIKTGKKNCAINILEFEERPNDICGDCKPHPFTEAPWYESFLRGKSMKAHRL